MIVVKNNKNWLEQNNISYHKNAFIYEGNSIYSYGDVNEIVEGLCQTNNMENLQNQYVALVAANNSKFLFVVLSLWKVGAVPVIIPEESTEAELKAVLKLVNCNIILDYNNGLQTIPGYEFIHILFSEIDKNTPIKKISDSYKQNNPALVLLTSGSTGMPKPVLFNFDTLYKSVETSDSFIKHNISDVWLASLPFSHIGGFSIFIRTLLTGCSMIIEKIEFKKDSKFTSLSPTLLSIVPTQLNRIVKNNIQSPDSYRYVFVGGSACNNRLFNDGIKLNWKLVKVYGSTETTAMVTVLPYNSDISKFGSVGLPLNHINISTYNSSDKHVVTVKSASVAIGYFTDSGIKYFKNEFCSNDIGFIDKDGYLFIEGRIDDFIISGGINISTKEIEKVLNEIVLVNEAFVFGIPDLEWGQKLCAAISLSKSISIDLIKNELKESLPSYKVPKEFFLVESLPKDRIGKVNFKKLKNLLNLNMT